jgi:nitrogen-specific signal transduction histidine kinase
MVFERFLSRAAERPGHRKGLAIVQDIVRAHGGYIDVDSEPGVGTEFNRLPPQRRTKLSSARILIVDDDSQIRRVMRTTLAQGYEAADAKSGEEASRIAKTSTT